MKIPFLPAKARVIMAMGAGKNAAYWVDEYIRRTYF